MTVVARVLLLPRQAERTAAAGQAPRGPLGAAALVARPRAQRGAIGDGPLSVHDLAAVVPLTLALHQRLRAGASPAESLRTAASSSPPTP